MNPNNLIRLKEISDSCAQVAQGILDEGECNDYFEYMLKQWLYLGAAVSRASSGAVYEWNSNDATLISFRIIKEMLGRHGTENIIPQASLVRMNNEVDQIITSLENNANPNGTSP